MSIRSELLQEELTDILHEKENLEVKTVAMITVIEQLVNLIEDNVGDKEAILSEARRYY